MPGTIAFPSDSPAAQLRGLARRAKNVAQARCLLALAVIHDGGGPSGRGATSRPLAATQGKLDPARLVFLDETWAKTNITRIDGRLRAADAWSAARKRPFADAHFRRCTQGR